MLPSRLEAGVGERAIPTSVVEMTKQICALVGTRTVRALVPHRIFHRAPWRALLRSEGLNWDQLPFGVSFSPALASQPAPLATSCHALGFGSAANGSIDLNDEARDFAALFGVRGLFVRDAIKSDFKSALASSATVLVSCHGRLASEPLGPRVTFKLSGGWTGLDEVLPDSVASPLVILSACDSGAYDMIEGDYPVGAAPQLLLKGAAYCACSRFPINADFARRFFTEFGRNLIAGQAVEHALASASKEMESKGADLWRDLACVELLVRGD